jgi:glyoxylase-like metal-dependent hydrolase (beta-lactamase superfamily II)
MIPPQFQPITESIHQLSTRWCGAIVNVWLIQVDGGWILVDTGPPGRGPRLVEAAETHLGATPQGIIVTHGHFDHTGGLNHLAECWGVPVSAHPEEHAFIHGERRYDSIRPADWRHRLLSRALPTGDFPG